MVALHTDQHDAGLESLVEMELTLSQARSVMALACAAQPLPINELAARLRLSVAATGRNVDQLVRSGLVDRVEDEHDRRIKRISLSDKGREQVHHFLNAKRSRALAFLRRLDPDDHARLLAALTPIVARCTNDHATFRSPPRDRHRRPTRTAPHRTSEALDRAGPDDRRRRRARRHHGRSSTPPS